jgi:hypothetical protein
MTNENEIYFCGPDIILYQKTNIVIIEEKGCIFAVSGFDINCRNFNSISDVVHLIKIHI